jgi:hypothetical protein
MGTWTKDEEQKYFYAVALRVRREKHRRMVVGTAIGLGMGLLFCLMIRVLF